MKAFPARLLAALGGVIIVLFQFFHLFMSAVAFDKLWDFVDNFIYSSYGKFQTGLTLAASICPLGISLIIAGILRCDSAHKIRARCLAAATTAYYAISLAFLLYRFETGNALDPFLIRLHLGDAWNTMLIIARPYAGLLITVAALLFIHYRGLLHWYGAMSVRRAVVGPVRFKAWLALVLALFAGVEGGARSSLLNLVLEFREPSSEARIIYTNYFDDSLRRNESQPLPESPLASGDNLFMFHLESLNARLVNLQTTPRFLEIAAEDGILFPKIQSSTVFTILSQETILCSVLPTIGRNLSTSRELFGKLVCLPEIMRRLGYKTLYFQNYPNIDFANGDEFFGAIGFDERHAGDIMQTGDAKIAWGYLEDVYYRRVFDYLRRFKGQKIFAYVLVCATNHYAFVTEDAQRQAITDVGGLPFPHPRTVRERFSNTTLLQDYYFGKMYVDLFRPRYGSNSHAVVFGDHSWPLGLHEGNEHNLSINGTFQENFVTSLAILPAGEARKRLPFAIGKQIDTYHTYVDIVPTVLQMYGITANHYYGSSFYAELLGARPRQASHRCLVSVQPFAGGSVVLLKYPLKHIFKLRSGTMATYDLAQDPEERSNPVESLIGSQELQLLDDCLKSIQYETRAAANP
jgi:Sulfatase